MNRCYLSLITLIAFFFCSRTLWANSGLRPSHPRGIYTSLVRLKIESQQDSNSNILYTLDGSRPSLNNLASGKTIRISQTATILVQRTTIVRAVLESRVEEPLANRAVDTFTYVFPADVFSHPLSYFGAGLSPTYLDRSIADNFTEFDQDPSFIVKTPNDPPGNSGARTRAVDSIKKMLIVSIAAPEASSDKEFPSSIELMEYQADGSTRSVQADAGIEIFGNSSIFFPKRNFKFSFKGNTYGVGKLRYENLFPKWGNYPARKEFNELLVRSSSHDSNVFWWEGLKGQYARNEWAQKTFFEMGHLGAHIRPAHVYLNGYYFGMYQVMERPSAEHVAEYMGEDENDLSAYRTTCSRNVELDPEPLNGKPFWGWGRDDNFNTCLGGVVAYDGEIEDYHDALLNIYQGKTPQKRIHIPQLMDYMLLNYFAGNTDWSATHNWAAVTKRTTKDGVSTYQDFPLHYIPWDNDFMLVRPEENVTKRGGPGGIIFPPDQNKQIVTAPFVSLVFQSRELVQEFADRAYDLFFNKDSPLHPSANRRRYYELTETIKDALPLEFARWYVPESRYISRWGYQNAYRFMEEWIRERARIIGADSGSEPIPNEYFPNRGERVWKQLVETFNQFGFPTKKAPQIANPLAIYPLGTSIHFERSHLSPGELIYFTTDGSDPRLQGGSVNPLASSDGEYKSIPIEKTFTLSARILTPLTGGPSWSPLMREVVIAENDLPQVPSSENLIVSFIHYHPLKNSQKEYFVLRNISKELINLKGLKVITESSDEPVNLEIQKLTFLKPNEELIVARNVSLVKMLLAQNTTLPYFEGPQVYPEPYQGKLSNGGAEISLIFQSRTIGQLKYQDKGAWSPLADGRGYALSIKEELLGPSTLTSADLLRSAAAWEAVPVEVPISHQGSFEVVGISKAGASLDITYKIPSYVTRHYLLRFEESVNMKSWSPSCGHCGFDERSTSLRHILTPIKVNQAQRFYRLRAE